MRDYEDEDIKIAGCNAEQTGESNGDTAAVAFKLQLENGNIEKAKHLGSLVANEILSTPFAENMSKQKIILIRFCVTNFITVMLQNETLTHIAVDDFENIIYDKLGVSADDDMVSEMYSVFLIAAREKINVAQHISQTYSRFCVDKEAAVSEALEIYDLCSDIVLSAIKSLNFVDIKAV